MEEKKTRSEMLREAGIARFGSEEPLLNHLDRYERSFTVNPDTDCWVWNSTNNGQGYARFWYGSKRIMAHKVAYLMMRGKPSEGLVLDHLCRVRNCVNPYHLEAVTNQENIARGNVGSNHRDKTHCKNGHILSGDNLVYYKSKRCKSGFTRGCRTCKRVYKERYLERLKNGRG